MRAQRFALELPVRYRPVGEAQWLDGKTENISHSGVLFHAEKSLGIDTPVEIKIALPVVTPAGTGSEVICRARIVRTETRFEESAAALAAAFSEYQLVRGPVPNHA
jgi:hypothetical protein